LGVCDDLAVDDYTRYCTVLTAYAESDFDGQAVSKNPTKSGHYSEGLFQQTLPWWPHDHFDGVASTKAFINHFSPNSGDPVKDCWDVQHWNAPNFRDDLDGFLASVETKNYTNRLDRVNDILRTGKLP
jgi:hypothetical protein